MRDEGRSGPGQAASHYLVCYRGEGHVFMEVGVLRVSVAAAHRAEHHVATGDFALMHLAQVHSLVVHAQGSFVAVHFMADVAEDPSAATVTAPVSAPAGRKEEWRGGRFQPLTLSFSS